MSDDERIDTLRELAAADPGDALTWYLLGTALVQTGEAEAAREGASALEKSLTLNADQTAAWRWLGDAWRKAGDPARARLAYQHAIEVAERTGELQVAKEARSWLAKLG